MHVSLKALYSGVDELRKRKADKDQIQIEVDEVNIMFMMSGHVLNVHHRKLIVMR